MASSDSQEDKPQHGRPKRAELPDVNINTGAQSIDTERASLTIDCPELNMNPIKIPEMFNEAKLPLRESRDIMGLM